MPCMAAASLWSGVGCNGGETMREGETIVTTEGQSMGLSFKGDAEFKTQEGKD